MAALLERFRVPLRLLGKASAQVLAAMPEAPDSAQPAAIGAAPVKAKQAPAKSK